jgi:glycosyltransferase involved in cell wall biosynthesis
VRVVVVVTAYQQAPYVRDAVRSVLAQVGDFDRKVLVSVDKSDDGTEEVVRELEREARGALECLFHSERVGLVGNYCAALSRAGGDIVALLEADDQWLVMDKLLRQVELLDRSPGSMVVGHSTEQVTADGSRLAMIPARHYSGKVPREEYLERECDFHTSSLVFRNAFCAGWPAEVFDPDIGVVDLPLKIALAGRGEIGYIPETMSRFRRVPGSASSGHDDRMWHDVIRRSFENTRRLLPPDLRRVADRKIADYAAAAAVEAQRNPGERAALALLALRRAPRLALAIWAKRGYGRLPEPAKDLYRGMRGRRPGGSA